MLLAVRGEAVVVRAYSETMLSRLSAHCNLVYWTDLLPAQIDPLLARLPPGLTLYRHHCCWSAEEGVWVKDLGRLGCEVGETVVIDHSEAAFGLNRERGVELVWMGKRRDCVLLDCLAVMMRFMEEGAFGECVESVRRACGRHPQSRAGVRRRENRH